MPESIEKLMNLNNRKEKAAISSDEERFEKIMKYILRVEEGYTNNKNDPEGKTAFGITEKEARKHGYKGDMRKFPKKLAKEIYKKDYYDKNRLGEVEHDGMALSIFDFSVNAGRWGVRKAQEALNKINGTDLTVDGIMGKETIEALNKINPEKFLKVYHKLQISYYRSLIRKNPAKYKGFTGWFKDRMPVKEKFIKENMMGRKEKNVKKKIDIRDKPKYSDKEATVKNKDEIVKRPEIFEKAFRFVVEAEGGYTETGKERRNYGITESMAVKYGYEGDMRNMSEQVAKDIYNKEYYRKNRLNEIRDAGIALTLFDSIVKEGSEGIKRAQTVLNVLNKNNDLEVNGIIERRTLEALNNTNVDRFLEFYDLFEREIFRNKIKENPKLENFLTGIIKRINKREDYINENIRVITVEPEEISGQMVESDDDKIVKKDKETEKIKDMKDEYISGLKTDKNENKTANDIKINTI